MPNQVQTPKKAAAKPKAGQTALPSTDAKGTQLILTAVYTPDGFVPELLPDTEALFGIADSAFAEAFAADPHKTLYSRAFGTRPILHPSIAFLLEIAGSVIQAARRDANLDFTRHFDGIGPESSHALLSLLPNTAGREFVDEAWIGAVAAVTTGLINAEFAAFSGSAEEFFAGKDERLTSAGRVFFHLAENRNDSDPFAFLATYASAENGRIVHKPLANALEEMQDTGELIKMLSAVSRVADKSALVASLMQSGELFSPLKFTSREAHTFLVESPMYEECGVTCRIPDFWRKKSSFKVSLSSLKGKGSTLGVDSMMAFDARFYFDDEELSLTEIRALAEQEEGLMMLRGKWVELDREKLQAALDAYEHWNGSELSLGELIRLQSGLGKEGQEGLDTLQVSASEWLAETLEKMREATRGEASALPDTFLATLRPYQQTGYEWLSGMGRLRFGALLADDMGLGKTVQVLALLESMRREGKKTLLVIPASLTENWRKEAQRFAPELRVRILHGAYGSLDFSLDEADVFLTTYTMASKIPALAECAWDLLILDEAQAIKNPGTRQTKTVKSFSAKARIAMTGTPVENNLGELWSLFDFLDRGLLGTKAEFDRFAKRLKEDLSGYGRLRDAVSPFMLRRLKTDKSIISDLPDKIEIDQYATLTKRQVAIYAKVVNDLKKSLEDADGISRRGLVLASLMKLKQICNHPDQFLSQNAYDPKHSGKYDLLEQIAGSVSERHERLLVFTQFREMTEPLARFLRETFGRDGLVLHGGTPIRQRAEMVAAFNGEAYVPFMVLSLGAGGVGLNLTAANHVVHFDRWWNPAVENQATDRAYRIGQSRNVSVYRFITAGTIEEKIDAMIKEKTALAKDVIPESSGEAWITEMDNEELVRLFTLDGGADNA